MNLEAIAKNIQSRPATVQIAKDGNWEQAWILSCTQQSPTQAQIISYLSKESFETVEIEILFEQPEGVYILGIDHAKHLLLSKPEEFLLTMFQIVETYTDFLTCIKSLDKILIGKPYFFHQEPDVIRIGVVNHWFSVGPLRLWKYGQEKIMKREQLNTLLKEKPQVFSTHLNYQGMSFVSNIASKLPGTCHWIKAPCSNKKDDTWILNPTMIQHFLYEWDNFQIV